MILQFIQAKALLLFHLIGFIFLAFLAIHTPSVGGDGDTIMHYFWANYALSEPAAFFNNWAKPFFTLFAAPSTLFGFTGIKIFNIFCGVSASYLASILARDFQWKLYWLMPLIAFGGVSFAPYLFSGLTEPFAALVLILGIRLLQLGQEKNSYFYWGFLLLSFLPYCRSEALVLLPLFALIGLYQKVYKATALLLFGTIFYSLSGSFFNDGNIFWLFDSPYKSGASIYGKGSWLHYFSRLKVMLGLINYYLLLLSIGFSLIFYSYQRKLFSTSLLLIFAPAVLFFTAHTVVWALGIFASAGLERVLILTFPLYWLIIIHFLSFLSEYFGEFKKFFGVFLLLVLSLLSYKIHRLPNSIFYWDNATLLRPQQKFEKEVICRYLNSRYPNLAERKVISDLPFVALSLNINPLDPKQVSNWERVTKELWSDIPANSIFIWDSKTIPFYFQLDKEQVLDIPWLGLVKQFNFEDTEYLIFETNEKFREYSK